MKIVVGPVWRKLFVVALILGVSLGAATHVSAQGIDGGKFDGAVWKFTLTPKKAALKTMYGRYRVEGLVLYQRETHDDKEVRKVVGKKVPAKPGKVHVEFTDLHAFVERGTPGTQMKGSAHLSFDRFGNWSGTFVDSGGGHWDFKCERVQE